MSTQEQWLVDSTPGWLETPYRLHRLYCDSTEAMFGLQRRLVRDMVTRMETTMERYTEINRAMLTFTWRHWLRSAEEIAEELEEATETLAQQVVSEAPSPRTMTLAPAKAQKQPDGKELPSVNVGGYAEALARIGLLLSETQDTMPDSNQARIQHFMTNDEQLEHVPPEELSQVVEQQHALCMRNPESALKALPQLLRFNTDRKRAMSALDELTSGLEMNPKAKERLTEITRLLKTPVPTRRKA